MVLGNTAQSRKRNILKPTPTLDTMVVHHHIAMGIGILNRPHEMVVRHDKFTKASAVFS